MHLNQLVKHGRLDIVVASWRETSPSDHSKLRALILGNSLGMLFGTAFEDKATRRRLGVMLMRT